MTGPHSVQFDSSGEYLFCGFDKVLKIVSVERPNSAPIVRHLKKQSSLQSGIISSIAINQQMYCVASYSGHIGLYDARSGVHVALIEGGHANRGITQVQFAMHDNLLVSAARKDSNLCVWDLRQISIPLAHTCGRNAMTNQRIRFDIHNNFLFSGSLDGNILMYDLSKLPDHKPEPVAGQRHEQGTGLIPAHEDCCNSVSCIPHPHNKQDKDDVIFLVSGSGQRRYTNTVMAVHDSDSSNSSECEDDVTDWNDRSSSSIAKKKKRKQVVAENCLKFWKIHK